MRAAILASFGGPERIATGEWPRPSAGPGQVLVRVRAAGMNPLDCKLRRGYRSVFFGLRPPAVLGFDLAGEVVEAGPNATQFKVGDAVFGSTRRPGAHAELAVAPESLLAPLPAGLGFAEAAALPSAGNSALIIVRDLARVKAGQRVLVNGAAGGVGHLALQLLRERGAAAVAVAGPANLEYVRGLGAVETIDHTREDFVQRGGRYAAVLDLAGTRSFPACRPLLEPRGVYVTTAPSGAALAWSAWTGLLARFSAAPRCRVLLLRTNGPDLRTLAAQAAAGRLRLHIEESFPLEEARRAHERLESRHVRGKLVLTVA
jgi:NADPH:quinone reductase-like Zn-dependent oxidoreductase